MPSIPEQIGSLVVTVLLSTIVLYILFKTITMVQGCDAPNNWSMCILFCVLLGVVLIVIGQMVYFWRGNESDSPGTRNFLSILIMVLVGAFIGFFTILTACTNKNGNCRSNKKIAFVFMWTMCFCTIVGVLLALCNYISKDID